MKPRRFDRLPSSMQWRMTTAIAAVFLVMIVAFGWLSVANIRDGYALAGEAQLELTRRIATDLDAKLEGALAAIESMGTTFPANAMADPGHARRWLQSSPQLKTAFFDRGLFLFDRNHKLLATDAAHPAIALDPEFHRWVGIAMRLDEPLIAQPCRCGGAARTDGSLVLPMIVPIHDAAGQVTGAMAGAADIQRKSLLGGIPLTRLGQTGYFFVTSWDGSALVHPDPALLLRNGVQVVPTAIIEEAKHGFRGPVATVDHGGDPVLATFVKMQATGWVLGANYPTREAYAHLHRQQRDVILFIVLGTLAAAAATWFLMHRFVAPIRRFAADIGAIDVAAGLSLDPVPVPKQSSEIAQLGKSFNELVARLNDERTRGHIADRVFRNIREGIIVTDLNSRIVSCNEAFEEITGYRIEEVQGLKPSVLSSGRHDAEFYRRMWHSVATTGVWQGEIWNRRKNGEIYPQRLNLSAAPDMDGAAAYYVGVFSDITELKARQDRLETMATSDPLTGLPNRALLADRLRQDLAHAERLGHMLAVAFVDLDGFKGINDREGHHVGDALLIEAARRLRKTARLGDTAARLGGDEFVLLLTDVASREKALAALERLLEAISAPYLIEGRHLGISASIGVTFFPADKSDPDTLLRHADHAMYQAKNLGRARIEIFDPQRDQAARSRQQLAEAARRGIDGNEFILHYQPKVDLRSRRLIGVEALLRWQHPERGLLHPDDFIAALDGDDVASDIGEWVVAEACRQMAHWLDSHGLQVAVSVNLTARHLARPGFVDSLRQALARHPTVRPEWIEIEILESDTAHNPARIDQVVGDCRALGCRVALDDFGTGHSSLARLRSLSADVLKIDRSFVGNMLASEDDQAIVEGIVRLAHVFKRDVIAEGVETSAHIDMLCEMGCYRGQGHGIARPMPAADLPDWIRAQGTAYPQPGIGHA